MPADVITHPDKEQLIAFGLGKLDLPDSVEIEAHLNECAACCDTLLNLKDDTFIGLVRQSAEQLPSEAAADLLPPELADHPRYRVLKLAGKGGMGLVFKAEHKLMNRIVALKVIHQKLVSNAEAVQRFRREVQAAAQLTHPNIVTAYDAEQAGDVHFLVMEYVDGTNLSQVVEQGGALEIGQACEYVRQIADGLQHAHSKGMVHRDIKPHNLMVNPTGQIKILDFGLATLAMSVGTEARASSTPHSERSCVTSLGTMMGTPDFISPEQASDCRTADIRSDIYSLGCTLYYVLTGRPPFSTGTAIERIEAHATAEPEPIEAIRRDIPKQLAAVIHRMLTKDPALRFQTPTEVADALAPFAAGTHVNQPSPIKTPQPQPFGKRIRTRVKILIASATGGALAIAAAIFYAELQKTTVRFEVNDPSLSISFGPDSITVKDGDREFTVVPQSEQRFTIKQNGTDRETDTFTLNKGQKVALRIDAIEGRVRVTPSDGSVAVGKTDDPTQSVDAWVERLKGLREHNQTAFVIGPSILYIDPDKALEAVQKAWPQITIPEVKTGILKTFAFSKPLSPKKHPRVLQVLDLGMRDADPKIRAYAAAYVRDFSGIDFSHDKKAYDEWYAQNGQKPLLEVERSKASKVDEPSKLADFSQLQYNGPVTFWNWASQVASDKDPAAIPFMIGVIDADNTYDTIYGVGYYGLAKLTGVEYNESHNGAWWRNWWAENKSNYPQEVQQLEIPDVRVQLAALKKNAKAKAEDDPASDVADIPSKDMRAGGNKNMRYFLIGPRKEAEAPESGYKLLIVMPGGDGSADFNPFVRRIFKNALGNDYLTVQPVAFKWRPNQEIVWPTRTNKVDGQKFATEDFVEAIIRDVAAKHKVDKKAIYTLSWSSSGPTAYALALAKDTPVTGSYIAMSVFHPATLPPLAASRGRAFYIEHSPEDQICPFDQAKQAEESLKKENANVRFNTYDGGHGWRGDVFGRIKTGVEWLDQQTAKNK